MLSPLSTGGVSIFPMRMLPITPCAGGCQLLAMSHMEPSKILARIIWEPVFVVWTPIEPFTLLPSIWIAVKIFPRISKPAFANEMPVMGAVLGPIKYKS